MNGTPDMLEKIGAAAIAILGGAALLVFGDTASGPELPHVETTPPAQVTSQERQPPNIGGAETHTGPAANLKHIEEQLKVRNRQAARISGKLDLLLQDQARESPKVHGGAKR